MKNFTTLLVFALISGIFMTSASTALSNDIDWSEIETVLDKTHASGNMPDFINDAGATRGAGFNGDYVFVASRQGGGDFVYYWDVNEPGGDAGMLDLTGVGGGTFTLADMTVVGNHIFVSNMVFAGGGFKLYHWDGMEASPTTLIQYNTPVRLGDAITVLGDPDDYAEIFVSAHGGSAFYIWQMENGQLINDEPIISDWEYGETTSNFARVSQVLGKPSYGVASGPGFGPVLINLNDGTLTGSSSEFFPDWPMYAHAFVANNERYMVLMRVRGADPSENVLYVLDLNEGASLEEAFELLGNSTFAEKVVHQVSIGDIPNGNASVSVDLVKDDDGNLHIMGFAAGNGFIVQKIELPEDETDPDDPVEVSTLAELREKPDDGTVYVYTGHAVITAMNDFRNRKFIQDETAAILIDDNPGIITTEYALYDVITNIEGKINIWNNMVRFQPTENTEPATENTPVYAQVFALDAVNTDDQAKLVKFEQVFFVENGNTFENGENYTITDGENTFVLRTDFFNVDYIGEPLPASNVPLDITGVILQHQETLQIVPRFADDFFEYEVTVQDIESIDVRVYPNPAGFMLNIEANTNINEIRMIDMLGQLVYTSRGNGFQHAIDVSMYRNGIYFVQLITAGGTLTERIHIAR